jgi:hypothetical protein
MTGASAVYIRRIILDDDKEAAYDRRQGRNPFATLERKFPLEGWRGKQLRLTLRFKNEGGAVGQAMVRIEKDNATAVIVPAWTNRPGNAWQSHQAVLAVPNNATFLAVDVRLRLTGTVWVDSVGLEEVGKEVPPGGSIRADYACTDTEPVACDPRDANRRLYMSWQSSLSH